MSFWWTSVTARDWRTTRRAVIKKLYKIDLDGASESQHDQRQRQPRAKAVTKALFLDVVAALNSNGIASFDIPAKLEGIAFGQDVTIEGEVPHTLYIQRQ